MTFMLSLSALISLQMRVVSASVDCGSADCGNFIRHSGDCLTFSAITSTPKTNNEGLKGHPCRTPQETLK